MREARVAVHLIGLDDAPAEKLTRLLDEDERARAERFVFASDRQRYVAAHAALRLVLAKESGIPATSLRFVNGRHGKPHLHDAPDIGFNLSHSGECALLAVTRGLAIGVDLEAIRPDIETDALGKRFLSLAEQAELFALPAEQRVRGFFNAWTRKEAYLKGRGEGITFGLDHFDVSLTPDMPAALRTDRRNPDAASRWLMTDLPVPSGFVAAVALDGAMPKVTYHNSSSRWTL